MLDARLALQTPRVADFSAAGMAVAIFRVMTIARVALLTTMALWPLACGSSLNGPGGAAGTGVNTGQAGASAGAAGTTGIGGGPGGTGGTGVAGASAGAAGTTGIGGGPGGTGGTGGTGVGGAPVLPPPSCLSDLVGGCPLAGECKYSQVSANELKKCFASGQTVSSVSTMTTSGRSYVSEVRRADGTLCYSIESNCSSGTFCEVFNYVWKDGSGAVVARGQTFNNGASATCEATGETCTFSSGFFNPDLSENCIPSRVRYATGDRQCPDGTCP